MIFCPTPSLLTLDLDFPPLFHLPKDLGHSNIYMSNIISLFLTCHHFFWAWFAQHPTKKSGAKQTNPAGSCPPPQKKNNQLKNPVLYVFFNSCRIRVVFLKKNHRNFHRFLPKKTPPCRSCFGALPPRPCHLLERSLGRLRDAVAGQLREVLSISVSVVSWGGKKPRQGRKARLVLMV